MARVSSNDALEKFRFLVDFSIPKGDASDGTGVALARAGFHDIQMPKRSTNKISYREGHDPDISSLSAGLSTMEDIVMSRGVVKNDPENIAGDFLKWAAKVHKPTTGVNTYVTGGASVTADSQKLNYRAEVTIKLLDREGNVERQWKLYNCFPVNFTPGSDLNAGEDGEKSMEALTLAYEDFQEISLGATPSALATDT